MADAHALARQGPPPGGGKDRSRREATYPWKSANGLTAGSGRPDGWPQPPKALPGHRRDIARRARRPSVIGLAAICSAVSAGRKRSPQRLRQDVGAVLVAAVSGQAFGGAGPGAGMFENGARTAAFAFMLNLRPGERRTDKTKHDPDKDPYYNCGNRGEDPRSCILINKALVAALGELNRILHQLGLGNINVSGGDSTWDGKQATSDSTGETIGTRKEGSHHNRRNGNNGVDIRNQAGIGEKQQPVTNGLDVGDSIIDSNGLPGLIDELSGCQFDVLVKGGLTDSNGFYTNDGHVHLTYTPGRFALHSPNGAFKGCSE